MANIFDLEVNNLLEKDKKVWHYFFATSKPEQMEQTQKWVEWSESVKKSKTPDLLGKTLKKYFADNPDDFIKFQKSSKTSLYNQTIKKHDFKDLTYKDMVEKLTPEQKKEIIDDISGLTKYLKPNCGDDICGENCDYHGEPYLRKNTPENREIIEKEEKYKYQHILEDPATVNYKYVLVYPKGKSPFNEAKLHFFKDDDKVIFFALNKPNVFDDILTWHDEILNPHYEVNNWIVTNYELELDQKDELEQSHKFESPKMKM